jgi:hypothetical protein
MLQSHVVEVNGTFVGAAITTAAGFRFRAIHPWVEDLDESTWRSMDELSRAVSHLFTTGRTSTVADPSIDRSVQSAARSLLLASAPGASTWVG